MHNKETVMISRRLFLVKSMVAGAGLTLGMALPGCSREEAAQESLPEAGPGKAGGAVVAESHFAPNAFVRIGADDRVTVIIKHLEMGQGTYTGLATLVAEELDAAWSQIEVEGAPADANTYNNLFWGKLQGTGGSTAIANSYEQMRNAGAAARHMLVAAAARQWQVPAADIDVQDGVLRHAASGRQATFGTLAELAAQEAVPETVFLKDPEEFRLIGTRVPRKDSRAKVNGSALFTQDVQLPGMLTALVVHPPRFGARLKDFDASKAKQVPGVVEVVGIPAGVAVLANDFWSAKKGRDALQVEWDETDAFMLGSAELVAQYRALADTPGSSVRNDGDAGSALQSARQTLQTTLAFPYLAHAALEPMNCVMQRTPDGVEVWNGEQYQTPDQQAVAGVFGIAPEQVKINMLYAGGSFGRRANPHSDYLVETATIVKAIGGRAPVKLVRTREDDMRAGYYRPLYVHKIEAGLDAAGNPVAWHHRIVGQSIAADTAFEGALIKDGVDVTSVEGVSNLPYAIPNINVELHSPVHPVPVQWWRSVGSTHTAFAVETFIDRLAAAAGRDPVVFRRALLKAHPRHLGVMELAADKAGWGSPLAPARGRGIAVHESFNSYVAQVAEVTVHADKTFSVDRVVIAVDCGIAVNPDVVRAQMEGGMAFGLAAALNSELTLEQGRVVQSNFHDYRVLRIDEMPEVEVHIVTSTQPPTGVGEPATPVIAPAVANALSAATGQWFDRLPLQLSV
ncbi:MAG: xanthine dehydrogenase family protein molybdopterin-binding subunit [Gammaproteobacteria bacterium]|nr:xanthine dehydrogenase family protein molybdopterin-binding subunit [Gammaproteobacteria bacterium]MDH3560773.1 xanthine dehydrogenase family protein molybdopterin-binding subunit [Gammaproteobacteria bacterium]